MQDQSKSRSDGRTGRCLASPSIRQLIYRYFEESTSKLTKWNRNDQDINRFWEDVREKADPPGVRIRILRHTFTSLLVSGGMTQPMIGKRLGHT